MIPISAMIVKISKTASDAGTCKTNRTTFLTKKLPKKRSRKKKQNSLHTPICKNSENGSEKNLYKMLFSPNTPDQIMKMLLATFSSTAKMRKNAIQYTDVKMLRIVRGLKSRKIPMMLKVEEEENLPMKA